MKITLTGGSGFIGRRLMKTLAASGHTVHVMSRHAGTNLPPGVKLSVWDALKGEPPAPLASANFQPTVPLVLSLNVLLASLVFL